MLKTVKSLILFAKVFIKIFAQCIQQFIYYLISLKPILNRHLSYEDGTILKSDVKRIRYFSLLVPVLIGDSFSTLLSQNLTKQNRKILTLASAITPLFDDYFEQGNLSITRLENLILFPHNFSPINNKDKLIFSIYLELAPLLIDKAKFFEMVKNVFLAQKKAQQQKSKIEISQIELHELTFNKGGLSVLLFNSLILKENTDLLVDIGYQAGGLIQYADDIFDLWFDWKDGIKTLPNNCETIAYLSDDYSNQIKTLITLSNSLGVDSIQKRKFIEVQLFFLSRAFIAINQLTEITKTENGKFNPDKYSRQQLVCDMEKFINIKSWIKEYYRILNLIR